jgi:hypothetical protein
MTATEKHTEASSREALSPKVGDVVHVRGTVTIEFGDGDLAVQFTDSEGDTMSWAVRPTDIVHIEPRPLKVGDRVTWGTKIYDGELIAIRGEYGFIDMGGHAAKEPMRNLTRVDGSAA